MTLVIRRLDRAQDTASFDCGQAHLNNWLASVARQHQKNAISQTYVLSDDTAQGAVLGYYALALRAMTPSTALPQEMVRKLPKSLPGITLARLAVSKDKQGLGFGRALLIDAMRRARQASGSVGGWAMFVDAKDDRAAAFYRRYGFIALPSAPHILFMPFAAMPE